MDAPEVAVAMVTATEFVKLPPLGVIVGVATVETAIGADTVKVKAVLLVMLPPVAFTVTGKFPVGVDPVVPIVSTVEQVGVQEVAENEPVAPEGSPEALNDTACVLPLDKVAVIELLTEDPAVTDRSPKFVSE
jgi:hypothetical protein